jgi:hypothetical protein
VERRVRRSDEVGVDPGWVGSCRVGSKCTVPVQRCARDPLSELYNFYILWSSMLYACKGVHLARCLVAMIPDRGVGHILLGGHFLP